jgi:glycosyltransferase involved in cell wall biosynthesis
VRILLVTPMPPRPEAPGAIPLVLHALVTGLRARHEITLVTVVGDEPGELEAAEAVRRSGLDVHAVDRRQPTGFARHRRRLKLATTWARGQYPWRTVWFADPAVQETLDRLASARSFDVGVVEDNSMGTFRLPADLPTVFTEHEVRPPREIDRQPRYSPQPWTRRTIQAVDRHRWPRYQRSVWQKFDRVQVFTDRDASLVADLAPAIGERVRVNPFGVAAPRPAIPGHEVPGTLLFAGNFRHPPNADAAVWLAHDVMPRVRAGHPEARLKLVGAGAPNRIRALSGEGVDFVGEVPTIGPALDSAALVLAPVRHGGGMRMKVLHALASGKAVVTTQRGAEGLILEDEEPPLVIADDADTIAAETARLLNDQAERRTLGERARAFTARRHSPEAYAERLEAVYEEAVAAHALSRHGSRPLSRSHPRAQS